MPSDSAAIRLFERPPILPFVPAPQPDETLSSWVSRIAEIYCLRPKNFLKSLGIQIPEQLRSIDVYPTSQLITELSRQTGVFPHLLLQHMTFTSLRYELLSAILHATPHCVSCIFEASPVFKRSWIAPWNFFCEHHLHPTQHEIHHNVDIAAMLQDVRRFSERLSQAARPPIWQPFETVPRGTADCIRLVRGINKAIYFHVFMDQHKRPVFRVRDLRPKGDIPSYCRNSLVVSAWYAWHIVTNPERVLYQHTASRDSSDAERLLKLLFHFLPADLLRRAWWRGIGLLYKAPDFNAPHPFNEYRQARLLRGPHRIDFTMIDPQLSPFACPEFGIPFSFNNQVSRLRLTEKPQHPDSDRWLQGLETFATFMTRSWRRPDPADLKPFSAAIEQVKLELAAQGRSARRDDIQKLAFRRMRERCKKGQLESVNLCAQQAEF